MLGLVAAFATLGISLMALSEVLPWYLALPLAFVATAIVGRLVSDR